MKPKYLFLIDAIGAVLTSLLLFLVLAQLEKYFGMPKYALYSLAGIAFILFIYSISCHLYAKSKWRKLLKLLVILNCSYLIISIGFLIVHFNDLNSLDLIYFIGEFVVIGALIHVEYKTLSKNNHHKELR